MIGRLLVPIAVCAALLPGADFDRTKPPKTGPIPDVRVPATERFTLPNGLTVVAAQDSRFPLLTVRIAFLAGSKFDPAGLPGLSAAVADLLNQGTKSRSAVQIAQQAADMGGQIGATSGPDSLTLDGSCLSGSGADFLALMADIARNASFPEDEVQLEKQNRLQGLRAERSQADYLGREMLQAVTFGEHPYAHFGPTEESIGKFDRASIVTFRDTYLAPNNAFLILVGRLPAKDELQKMVTANFGDWAKKSVPAVRKGAIPKNEKRLILVNRPGSVQANVFSSHVTPTYGSKEHFPLELGDQVLGGGTNSRLFMDIREKRSFAYDAHAETDFLKDAGTAMAVTEVRNEVAGDALQALNDDLKAMGSEDVKAVELTDAKNRFAGRFTLSLERQSALANQLARIEAMGLPHDYLDTFMTHVRSVEPDQIRETGKYWDPADATVVIVGDAQKIQQPLEKFGKVEVREPVK